MMNYLNFKCEIDIKDNPLNLDIDDFLKIGIRDNNKRKFLFISKNLGKHLPCRPKDMDFLGILLASLYKKKNKNNNGLIIGFAETATALAHTVFDALEGDYNFIHTTREEINNIKKIEFYEEHSHATNHKLYIGDKNILNENDNIILIDDEITTANTCLNIIEEIHKISPKNKYIIISILNWIDDEKYVKIEEVKNKLGCEIEFVYLFNGEFKFYDDFDINGMNKDFCKMHIKENVDLKIEYIYLDFKDYIGEKRYCKYTGRFGITKEEHLKLLEIVKKESEKLKPISNKVLVLGSEEFMYIPMLFAKNIPNSYYHSITRSPIISIDSLEYPINSKCELNSFYNIDVKNYIYNIYDKDYEECFLFVELNNEEKYYLKAIEIFKKIPIKKLNIVVCS